MLTRRLLSLSLNQGADGARVCVCGGGLVPPAPVQVCKACHDKLQPFLPISRSPGLLRRKSASNVAALAAPDALVSPGADFNRRFSYHAGVAEEHERPAPPK